MWLIRDVTRSWRDSFWTCRDSFRCVVTHAYVWRDSLNCARWLICDVTYLWCDSFATGIILDVTWLIQMRCDSFICVTWLAQMCDVTHPWRDLFVTWRDVTHSNVTWLIQMWRDSFICVTWLMYICDVTHAYTWRDSCIRVTWWIRASSTATVHYLRCLSSHRICDMAISYLWRESWRNSSIRVTWLMYVRDVTRRDVWRDRIRR